MHIKIKILNIHCDRMTHPRTNNDEIYLAYFVSAGKPSIQEGKVEVKKCLVKKISPVKKNVHKHVQWTPKNMTSEAKADEAKSLNILFALYEMDNGEIYKKLQGKVDAPIEPEEFEWSLITPPSDLKNPMNWLKAVWRALSGIFKWVVQDDLFRTQNVTWLDGYTSYTKDIVFRGHGGKYTITARFEKM